MKKIAKGEFEQYLEETRGLERDYIGEVLKSRKLLPVHPSFWPF